MLTDENIPPQFGAVKDPDEQMFWVGEPELLPFLCTGVPYLMIGLLWGALTHSGSVHVQTNPGDGIELFIINLFLFWGSILNMVRLALVYNNTSYAFTNKRLMLRSGFFGIDFKAIDYDKIVETEVTVNPVENLFGVGTIRVFSGAVTSKGQRIYDRFVAIENPYDVFKRIKEISVNVKTDWNFPNAMRPAENPGYKTKYTA